MQKGEKIMNYGFAKVGAYTPEIRVADVDYNTEKIILGISEAEKKGLGLVAFPELCVSGYTCGDLFYSSVILTESLNAVIKISNSTADKKVLVVVGAPYKLDGLIYNVAFVIQGGNILGIVPKSYLPNYSEFYEKRYFAPAFEGVKQIKIANKIIPFGKNLLFTDKNNTAFKLAIELCEDLWTPIPPSISHAVNGATVIVNLSCSAENVGKPEKRKSLVSSHSDKIVSAYVYANQGEGESTTDAVFSGHNLIAEHGVILAESKPFTSGLLVADVDLEYISSERTKLFNQVFKDVETEYITVEFSGATATDISSVQRQFNKSPFIPSCEKDLEFIINMQAEGLKKRLAHSGAKSLVIGLSGGLDSTLALIVCVEALKKLNRPMKEILAVTMPCFGTTSRTLDNSIKLAKAFGVTLKKVDISKAVLRHFKDIKQEATNTDVTYENSQARERTQVLMDMANMVGGLVVGTGDLSELTLGWATYNGDHMSMYAVNSSVPKTLVRKLVEYYAKVNRLKLANVLKDILDTPVSPELLPSNDKDISQKTEDIVGPYDLHDFYLYNYVKKGYSPKKIYAVACKAFKGEFSEQTILKWLKIFFRRFFNQQFKRSCLPDGVKIGEISLSPRGSWKMPSDAVSALWLKELEEIN